MSLLATIAAALHASTKSDADKGPLLDKSRLPAGSSNLPHARMHTLTPRWLLALPPTCSPHDKARAEAAASGPRRLCPCPLCPKRLHAQCAEQRVAAIASVKELRTFHIRNMNLV